MDQISIVVGILLLLILWSVYSRRTMTLARIMARQRADAKGKIIQSWIWGSVGFAVESASIGLEATLVPWRDTPARKVPYDKLLIELGIKLDLERHNPDDTYCHGVATYAETIRDLWSVQRKVTGQNTYALEQLYSINAKNGKVPSLRQAEERAQLREKQLLAEEQGLSIFATYKSQPKRRRRKPRRS